MAEYHLHVKAWSKGAGKGAGGHARYVLRDGPYSTKTVEQVEGATVQQVEVSRADEVVASISAHMPAWAAENPLAYWDAADEHERANGNVYREVEFALPVEMSESENVALAQAFAEALAKTDGGPTPYTLAIHRSEKDPALLHCHLMLSDKVHDGHDRAPAPWFKRAANRGKDPATGGAPKTQERGCDREKDVQWVDRIRPQWAEFANRALEQTGHDNRIDHRTLEVRRQEQEHLAEQAREKGDELAAARHQKTADALDRPAQPKKGRVLEHGGPERAPGQAQAWERHLVALAERQAALEAIETAERESRRVQAALEQAQEHRQTVQERWTGRQRERAERESRRQKLRDLVDLLRTDQEAKANLRAAYAAAGYRLEERDGKRVWVYPPADLHAERDAVVTARKAWNSRRQERVLDAAAREERRNGMRAVAPEPGDPARPSWAVYRERVLSEAYGAEVGRALGRWVKVDVDRGNRSLHIHNKAMDLTDYGDRVVAGMGGNDKEIAAMLQIAGAKGWKSLTLTGGADFQLRAGAAALAAGFTLSDGDLTARIVAQQGKDAEAQRVKDLEAVPVLAEWMRAHPKQAQAQRLAGGKIPFACPDGLDRRDLQRDAIWVAADAWSVGRYGERSEIEALKKDPDPLKAQAVGAGREAAFNAWAQRGITLRIGVDAPAGSGITWTLSGKVTRESVESYAGIMKDRRARAGVDHGVTVTFGKKAPDAEKVLVLEHLLRQSVPLDARALEQAGEGHTLDQARSRLRTHEADGAQQAWYVRDLEQKAAQRQRDEVAKIRAERIQKLDALVLHLERHGSGNSGKHFQEAGFVVDEKGKYAYPDPDLPGVRAAWDALATAQRKELEADLQKRAEEVGYRAESGQWSQERRNEDPERQRLVQEIKVDPSLKDTANTAYKQGISRAKQEREAQREQDRKALLKAAKGLGVRAEKGSSNAMKQAEDQREFVELVRRGVGLGVDEKALSQSMQGGREAYRQELARSRSRGMEL